jgi:serine/threonine protein kinase
LLHWEPAEWARFTAPAIPASNVRWQSRFSLPFAAADPEFKARFDREARTISQLNHPNICVLHDVGESGGTSFLVMELLEGETLAERLQKGALLTDDVLRIAGEIADALDKAHRKGIIHRDLKPANVMLTPTGAKLLDFGLAKPAVVTASAIETQLASSAALLDAASAAGSHAPALTAKGTILGTFQYMAPEQIEGDLADARSDIWSFGCLRDRGDGERNPGARRHDVHRLLRAPEGGRRVEDRQQGVFVTSDEVAPVLASAAPGPGPSRRRRTNNPCARPSINISVAIAHATARTSVVTSDKVCLFML